MKAFDKLPENYGEILSINLEKDKKIYAIVNALSIIIAVLAVVPMLSVVPFTATFEGEISQVIVRGVVFLVSMFAYIVLHELVHGITMKMCGTKKVKYGYKGLYAFAGSDDYYDKSSYILIALAPVVFWGVVLAVVNCFVPDEWFWIVYLIQVINLSGAAGDFYVTFRFSKLPKDVLITDDGVSMKVFSGK